MRLGGVENPTPANQNLRINRVSKRSQQKQYLTTHDRIGKNELLVG